MQISRFTASKPSKSAIASVEKFTRQLTTLIARYFLKAFFDRLRRCDAAHNHALAEKRCVLVACAGGTGRGTLECLTQLERGLTHMGMRVYDRIGVMRYNRDYMLPALYEAGKVYSERLENGFDMYY